jgi:hypothetical protein
MVLPPSKPKVDHPQNGGIAISRQVVSHQSLTTILEKTPYLKAGLAPGWPDGLPGCVNGEGKDESSSLGRYLSRQDTKRARTVPLRKKTLRRRGRPGARSASRIGNGDHLRLDIPARVVYGSLPATLQKDRGDGRGCLMAASRLDREGPVGWTVSSLDGGLSGGKGSPHSGSQGTFPTACTEEYARGAERFHRPGQEAASRAVRGGAAFRL